jgi:adenine/guanine phosphoribosyltransferase-like PRPP-binding protein
VHLLKQLGANVLRTLFVVELDGLGGRDQLAQLEVRSLVRFKE